MKNSLTAYKIMFFKKITINSFNENQNIQTAIKIMNGMMMEGIICSFQAKYKSASQNSHLKRRELLLLLLSCTEMFVAPPDSLFSIF